jgi:hypothetical protein
MRSFALLTLSTVLAFAACNEKESATSATESMAAGTTMEPETTAEPPGTTTSTTTGETTTSGTASASEAVPTTGPTPTTGTTAEETTTTTTTTSTTTTTTGETETGGETTGTVIPSSGPFESCNNTTDVDCDGNAVCVDNASTSGKITGAFCAPKCMGQGSCPQIQGLAPNVQPVCAFDTNMDSKADICALPCVMASDNCPGGSKCEDIGIPEMQMMKFGVCTWPPA